MMKNLPTILTVSRMTMGPILAALILWAGEVVYADPLLAAVIYALSLMLFLVAAMSDWVDAHRQGLPVLIPDVSALPPAPCGTSSNRSGSRACSPSR